MTSSIVVDAPSNNPGSGPVTARPRGRLAARARRLVLFLALGAVVLSFGLVAGSSGASDPAPTFSETALADARAAARNLAAEAQALAGEGQDPLATELRQQAEGLRTQAALLADTGQAQRSSAAAGGGARTADAADPQTPEYLQELAESADVNLRAAWRADPGTARLLAAAGAAQQVWAARGGALAGPDPSGPAGGTGAADRGGPGTAAADAGGNVPGAGADSPECPDGAVPGAEPGDEPGTQPAQSSAAAAPSGTGAGAAEFPAAAPDAAAALRAAVDAEFGTAYAYEVALAQVRPPEAERTQWQTRVAEHESRGADAVAYLPGLCLPAVAPVAGYRLEAAFLQDPAAGLPALEQQFPAVYADLVALSEGGLRSWAIGRLAAVTNELYLQADTVPAAPGLAAVPDDLPWN
ncbi:DUF4439 domain-containing protein [Arthrobacter yangruifuii]|uniref:DUF4439 domain-containing protein n=1 Tax=Arthrobacter yangruifuii TaxID=2606616 RepID=UPI0018853BA6|nr:DUF4439 domain-containing protein [Arthrobacter yangruifuii]